VIFFGGAFNIPANIYYIPFDLSTFLRVKGKNPDITREKILEINEITNLGTGKHNALFDAMIIKEWVLWLELDSSSEDELLLEDLKKLLSKEYKK
jgi:hypothetical protein